MKHKAFTVLELILVVAIVGTLAALVVPRLGSTLFVNQIEVATQEVVHVLRQANAQASTQIQDASWGVYFDSASEAYTLYAGDDYASRDVSFDIEYQLPGAVFFDDIDLTGGGTEVLFEQATGQTTQDGSVSLSSEGGDTRTIQITTYGHVREN